MKVLKLVLYQNLCNYRVGGSYGYVQSYPLPTPSMIIGMVHNVLDLKEYTPMSMSIQGTSDAVITNMQRIYKFDRVRKKENEIILKGINKSVITGILFIDLHININLIIHIKFENNYNLIDELQKQIQNKLVILGRNEDFARVDKASIVELNSPTTRTVKSKFPMYIKKEVSLSNDLGTIYRLPFCYEKVNSFKDNRIFKFIDAVYIGKNCSLNKELVYQDEDGDIVYLLNLSSSE